MTGVGAVLKAMRRHDLPSTTPPPDIKPEVAATWSDLLAQEWGINTHFSFGNGVYSQTVAVRNLVIDLGVRIIRDRLIPGNTPQEQSFPLLAAAGVKVHSSLGRAWSGTQADVNEVAAAIKDIGPEIWLSVGGWNEPAGGDAPTNWASLTFEWQKKLYNTFKADPLLDHLPIVGPAQRSTGAGVQQWYETMGATGIASFVDYGDFHAYPGGQQPTVNTIEREGWASDAFAGKPLYCTEGGYNTRTDVTGRGNAVPQDAQGVYYPRHLLEHFIRGVRFMSYELLDDPPGSTNDPWEEGWGIVETPSEDASTWIKKPAYLAMQALLGLVEDVGTTYTPAPLRCTITGGDPDRRLLFQRRDGTHLLMLWRDVKVYNPSTASTIVVSPQTVTVDLQDAADVTVYKPSTSYSTPTSTLGVVSQVQVPVAGELVVLEIG